MSKKRKNDFKLSEKIGKKGKGVLELKELSITFENVTFLEGH